MRAEERLRSALGDLDVSGIANALSRLVEAYPAVK
jgi:hypothetical protein